MNSNEPNKIRIKKTYHSTDSLDYPIKSEEERRRNATNKVQEEADKHPFSKVYSKQYVNKYKKGNLHDDL